MNEKIYKQTSKCMYRDVILILKETYEVIYKKALCQKRHTCACMSLYCTETIVSLYEKCFSVCMYVSFVCLFSCIHVSFNIVTEVSYDRELIEVWYGRYSVCLFCMSLVYVSFLVSLHVCCMCVYACVRRSPSFSSTKDSVTNHLRSPTCVCTRLCVCTCVYMHLDMYLCVCVYACVRRSPSFFST